MQSVPLLTIEWIEDWLRHRGAGMYGGEAVTQLEHALQCASLASADGAASELVTAALLHDICHLADDLDDRDHPHGPTGAAMLKELFPPAVTEPVRMHVDAKRYLCAIEPLYWSSLSDASKRSLMWQGGPFTPDEAAAFIAQPHAEDAVCLRRWDDEAKVPGAVTAPLDEFITIMHAIAMTQTRVGEKAA
ncbi:MAG TPA: HD domain-containing protein [Noviherbaspirillum sp.]|jgi:phosphonate degradation associated HDIG domain protein|uniref:HD domain-containing protein n=1 Tax=Noviherbaspirillum sp. TaxID=1926288 RepID=UPI002DDD4739|nr:HD domain-containing protein [Noviherbaspirillum sp.]HEV2611377.1 HD domain-containing protein [Noviherbaspirillum sp.]